MNITLRPALADDLPAVLAINQDNLPAVSTLTQNELVQLAGWANYFKVAINDSNQVLGFLLCLGPGQPYQSLNYTWFTQRYQRFLYVDRIAISSKAQRQGLGSRFYKDAASIARASGDVVLCEVNIKPRNDDSLAFHERWGFKPVGEQDTDGGKKRVRLLMLEP